MILHTDRGPQPCGPHGCGPHGCGPHGCGLPRPGPGAVDGPGRLRTGQRRRRGVQLHLGVYFVHRHRFATRAEARIKVATWIADFYNTSRRHSANDGLAPITFEHQMVEARRASTAQLRAEVA
ncbi:IS3 family transposase [Actinomadura rubrisoli]|uniref:IS3 family transposase n=1 Tax=Actinomadura rubrisoli TaxID=2530368 RepID=UPI003C7B4C5C